MQWFDGFIEANDSLVNLGADTTNKPVAKRRHPPQKNYRSRLSESISLR
jgi:hypothetical protein